MYLYAYFFTGENMTKDDALNKKAENARELGLDYEPVAWLTEKRYAQLHTPQRTWVGLTDEEIQYCVELKNPEAIAEEVEAKLKEKNT